MEEGDSDGALNEVSFFSRLLSLKPNEYIVEKVVAKRKRKARIIWT
jgi:hypothetical protein